MYPYFQFHKSTFNRSTWATLELYDNTEIKVHLLYQLKLDNNPREGAKTINKEFDEFCYNDQS